MPTNIHTFHIPVMGTGYSVDTPIKVAKYGISSVISLVDDTLIEEMRKFYCGKFGEEYIPIKKYDDDYRARRITEYLNLVDRIVKKSFEDLKNSEFVPDSEITKYFELLPDNSPLKIAYNEMLKFEDSSTRSKLQDSLREKMLPGSIDVNIMTKLNRENYDKDKKELPVEFSDALAALRGYAKSTLNSAIVFSAGFNRKLYSYVEKFEDFYANASGFIKKKIIVKVSDFRSSIVQGKFFAKKGLWVSEYRVESGLNCGGHAFATNGSLLGPILNEFKNKKKELLETLHNIYNKALKLKNRAILNKTHDVKITAQGGIGTSKEHDFLFVNYKIDKTGWATPFLLVPEATNVDDKTLKKLIESKEDDISLSDVSPLEVLFSNLNNSESELKRKTRINNGEPGSPCPKGHLTFNKEFTDKPICLASRQYQKLKIEQLKSLKLDEQSYNKKYEYIVNKSCLCHDLGAGAMIKALCSNENDKYTAAICPSKNIAHFSKIFTLSEMISHIYGRINLLNNSYRPHMFIRELKLYVEDFIKEVKNCSIKPTEKQIEILNEIKTNLIDGIEYYLELFPKMLEETQECRQKAIEELTMFKKKLDKFIDENSFIFNNIVVQHIK